MLQPLSIIKTMPRWDKKSPEFAGFTDDIRENGVRHPLQITAKNQVVDGETRRLGAMAAGLTQVPCIVVSDEEVRTIVLRELARRRNLTKGQQAYLLVPFLQESFNEALRNRHSNLKNGKNPNVSPKPTQLVSFADFCRNLGFSDELLRQARELHTLFVKRPDLQKEWEPKILDMVKPIGIGAALAGIGGETATKDKPFEQMEFVFKSSLNKLARFRNAAEARKAVQAFMKDVDDEDTLDKLTQLAAVIQEEVEKRAEQLGKGVAA